MTRRYRNNQPPAARTVRLPRPGARPASSTPGYYDDVTPTPDPGPSTSSCDTADSSSSSGGCGE